MEVQEDKHKSKTVFLVGNWVFLKLQPYMHEPVSCRSNHKLGFKYFGLPKCWKRWAKWHTSSKSSKFHPVAHVSLLKPAKLPEDIEAASESLQYDQSLVSSSKPAQVLQSRLVKVGGHTRK